MLLLHAVTFSLASVMFFLFFSEHMFMNASLQKCIFQWNSSGHWRRPAPPLFSSRWISNVSEGKRRREKVTEGFGPSLPQNVIFSY